MVHHAHGVESQTNTLVTVLLDNLHNVLSYRYLELQNGGVISSEHFGYISPDLIARIYAGGEDVLFGLLRNAPFAFAVYRDLKLYVAEQMSDHWIDVSLYRHDPALVSATLLPTALQLTILPIAIRKSCSRKSVIALTYNARSRS